MRSLSTSGACSGLILSPALMVGNLSPPQLSGLGQCQEDGPLGAHVRACVRAHVCMSENDRARCVRGGPWAWTTWTTVLLAGPLAPPSAWRWDFMASQSGLSESRGNQLGHK